MSYTIEQVKTVKEKLNSNYSSSQLLTLLDELIFRALEPIVRDTLFVDRAIGFIINWYGKPSKRKISSEQKGQVIFALFAFLSETDTAKKMEYLAAAKLERSVYFLILKYFSEAVVEYKENSFAQVKTDSLTRNMLKQQNRKIQLKVGARCDLFGAINESKYWMEQAAKFKSYIIEKYMRHALNRAMAYARGTKLEINKEDLVQNLILAVSKAIDKCDAEKGTLTTYVNHWIRSAQNSSESDHHYGLAYRIPNHMRRGFANRTNTAATPSNLSVNVETSEQGMNVASPDIVDEFEQQDEHKIIRVLAKYADPWGFARRAYGIDEELTLEEEELLLS